MSVQTDNAIFTRELERRLDELIAWATANVPNKAVSLTAADFADVRGEFCTIAGGNAQLLSQPEPEQGGPQYINDNPAPWP